MGMQARDNSVGFSKAKSGGCRSTFASLPEPVQVYMAHTTGGLSLRQVAAVTERYPSTVMRRSGGSNNGATMTFMTKRWMRRPGLSDRTAGRDRQDKRTGQRC